MSLLAGFGERVAALRLADVPAAVVTLVKGRVLDLVAAQAAAALGDPVGEAAVAYARAAGAGPGTVWGTAETAGPGDAAWALGTMARCLELDDFHAPALMHAGAFLVPAAIVAGEACGAPGARVLEAILAGYEVGLRIGMALGQDRLLARGFHPSPVSGVFGAAAAAAKAMGLGPEAVADALGLAAQTSAGLLVPTGPGAWTKAFHAGWAAHAGVTVARAAAAGFRGARAALEYPREGTVAAYAGGEPRSAGLESWGRDFLIRQVTTKRHACCGYGHAAIDGLLEIQAETGLPGTEIARVEIGLFEQGRALIAEPHEAKLAPASRTDAQFSLPFCAATAALRGRVALEDFGEEGLGDPRIADLARRVAITSDVEIERAFPAHFGARVRVRERGGRTHERVVLTPLGGPERPLAFSDIVAKFHDLAGALWPQAARDGIVATITALDTLPDLRHLTAMLRAPSNPTSCPESEVR